MIGPRASVLECAGAPALLLGGAGSWIAKRNVVTLRPSVSWIKGELLQKVTKETKSLKAVGKNGRNVRGAVRSIRMQVKSGGAPPRSKTLCGGENCPRECARLKCAGAGTLRAAQVRGPFVGSCSITVKIGAKQVPKPLLLSFA